MRNIIILLLISGSVFGNDSTAMRITKILTDQQYTHYWMKDIATGYKYYTKCECKNRNNRKKGDIVKIANKDLIIEGRAKYE